MSIMKGYKLTNCYQKGQRTPFSETGLIFRILVLKVTSKTAFCVLSKSLIQLNRGLSMDIAYAETLGG